MSVLLRLLFVFLLLLLAAALIGALRLRFSYRDLTRVDEEGALYSLDYTASYDNPLTRLPVALILKLGCSAFQAALPEGGFLTGRNFDYPHLDKEKQVTGLNVVARFHPQGAYASICGADLAQLDVLKIPCAKGMPEHSVLLKILLGFIPYLCMDGMNEKGLTASILYLDVKKGETAVCQNTPGLKTVTIVDMLRLILDHCSTVSQAACLAKNYNMHHLFGTDYHLFITDASGNSSVFEWRYNTFTETPLEAVTNFYVGYEDAEDCYYGDALKEKFEAPEDLSKTYHYGYGHGYGRFNELVSTLDGAVRHTKEGKAILTEAEAAVLLQKVSQEYTGDLTSYTQYSAIYGQRELTLKIYVQRDYQHPYTFSLKAGKEPCNVCRID